MQDLLKLAETAARRAGKCLLEAYAFDAGVVSDSGKDIKTEADKAAEEVVLEALRPTGISILSEESGLEEAKPAKTDDGAKSQTLLWVVDPLDGTFNFTRGFPFCCVSIGLCNGLEPIQGVIYDFVRDQMFSGQVGKGVRCNGNPLSVSSVTEISMAALSTGFPSARDFGESALADSILKVQRFKKIRMMGSAALSLAQVAAGHLDAYQEEDIWFWDVAAGLALVKAAGGDYTISEIKENWQLNVYAHNGNLNEA